MQLNPLQRQQLYQSPVISSLSAPLREAIAEKSELLSLDVGAYVHRKDDAFNGIHVLLSGTLKAMGVTAEGTAYSLAQINPGTVFGEIAYLDGGGRTHDAVCLTDSCLARIPPAQLDSLATAFTEFYPAMVRLACQHIRMSFAVVDDFLTLTPAQRLAKRLVNLHQQQDADASIQLKQDELAAWMGISRQSINKTLNQWVKQGWVKIGYGQLQILQADALARMYKSPSAS